MQEESNPNVASSGLSVNSLREAEAQFRAIANLVPDLQWRNDAQGIPT
jgi:hypothetical protein